MFSVIAVVNGVETLVENYDDCLSAVNDTLEHWNEEDGGATFYVKNEAGKVVITMIKPEHDLERAVVVYANGKVDIMSITYILDNTGRYLSTDIDFIAQVR
jgi:hypothetical protein